MAIARREGHLLRRLSRRIDDLGANFRRIIRINRNLGLFTTGYNYLIQIIPALVVAPLFFRGEVEFGVVTQSAMAFAHLVGAFSLVITQFQSISSYAAVVTRLGALDEGIDQAQARVVLLDEVCPHHQRRAGCPRCAERVMPSTAIEIGAFGTDVTYDRLTLLSPEDGRVLTKELTGTVRPGMGLLIAGPNEEAKGALFRATAGTWSVGAGRILRPAADRMYFLAERPYLPPGTLREALMDPGLEGSVRDERIASVLRDVGLDGLVSRAGGLDVERRWEGFLSFGEQQLVACARALLAGPRFVFLERPGSALDVEHVRRILELFARSSMSVLAVVKSGAGLGPFDAMLELEDEGRWTWRPASRGWN
jgi:putative ATP-binding cassette transporter